MENNQRQAEQPAIVFLGETSTKRRFNEFMVNNHDEAESEMPRLSKEDLLGIIEPQVKILNDTFSSTKVDRAAVVRAIARIGRHAGVEDYAGWIVQTGAAEVLVKHLLAASQKNGQRLFECKVEKWCAWVLALLASKTEHQQLIVDAGALPALVNILRRRKGGQVSQAVIGTMRRAANAIMNLADGNIIIQSRVRTEQGIPPLVELLEFPDLKIQRAAAGALRTLSLRNDDNVKQILECNALPTLISMLCPEDVTECCEAVCVIQNLVQSSPEITKTALEAGALQPVISLLSSRSLESQKAAAMILEQFALTDCKAHIVQRGAVGPLIEMVQSQDVDLYKISAIVLGRLALDTHNQAGIAQSGAIVPLLNLLDSNIEPAVQYNAALALQRLSDNEDNVVNFIMAGGVQKLQGGEFLLQPIRDVLSMTLERLEAKINGRVLSRLLYQLRVVDRTSQQRIALALAHLCSADDQKSIFIDSSGLDCLLELLASPDIRSQRLGSVALYKLADNARTRAPIRIGPGPPISPFPYGDYFVNDPRHADVTFIIEGRRFYARRTWLLDASEAFRETFGGSYRMSEVLTIEIPNIRWEVFELMIRYVYTGSPVEVSLDVAHDLLRLADQYLLEGLKYLCECTIARDISVENVSLAYELSEACDASWLRDACILFVLEKFDDLISSLPGYFDLIQSLLPEMRKYFVRELSRPVQ